jgi:hypothetical protein
MYTFVKPLAVLGLIAAPLLAGALYLEIGNPAGNAEAQAKHALLVARTTACHSPEKTTITASAEGLFEGKRRSIPLPVIALGTAGTFAVLGSAVERQPGAWVVKLVATNPEYHNFASSATIPLVHDLPEWAAVQRYSHEPAEAEMLLLLNKQSRYARAAVQ